MKTTIITILMFGLLGILNTTSMFDRTDNTKPKSVKARMITVNGERIPVINLSEVVIKSTPIKK